VGTGGVGRGRAAVGRRHAMPAEGVDTPRVASLSRRDARGFQRRAETILRPEVVASVNAQPHSRPLRAQMALVWACQAAAPRGRRGAARRLRMARGLRRDLQASAPATEGPGPGLLPTPRRPTPFRFTPTPITALWEAAPASRPRGSWRPHPCSRGLGLLASTGRRVGDAIR
jgi:hypothetical protein